MTKNIEEEFKPGQKFKMNVGYISRYLDMRKFENVEFTILSVKKELVPRKALSEGSRAPYEVRYGVRPEYPLYELIVKFDGDEHKFMVSQFGIA